jgi:hypothetical protein
VSAALGERSSDFPEGTRLIITARIEMPDVELRPAGGDST